MQNSQILEVKNLITSFRDVQAVKGTSFYLEKGKTLGIVGESGSGKSVTALSIMQLVAAPGKVTQGEILYRNKEDEVVDLLKLSGKSLRKYRGNEISMIFQEPMTSLNPVFTCGAQVMESLKLHLNLSKEAAREKTLELFNRVELPRPEKLLKSFPHQISGGQKQRVMIAMAMSCNPSILIADEPTTALDVTVQKRILSLMRELQEETEMSTIFISHDLGVIAEIADEVLVMYKGEIVERGDVLTIFENPSHPYTKGLLACRPPLDRKLHRLPTIADFWDQQDKKDAKLAETSEGVDDGRVIGAAPLLKVENLTTTFQMPSTWFGAKKRFIKAVDNVTFNVYPGETLGLVGESGCGKTTLGRSILRLIEPASGKVYFDGQSLTDMAPNVLRALRKQIQIIFQDPYSSLNPRIPIGKALMEPMKVHKLGKHLGEQREKVMHLLEKVGLSPEHFNRYPHEFSGGQRQRICIARALAVEPRFIICDESVSALDVSIQAQVLNLLKDLQLEFGFTYIFISHDLSVVRFMSDRIMVMREGKIVELGEADEVYEQPASPYTRQLIDAVPHGSIDEIRKRVHLRGADS